MKLNTQLSSPR